MTPDTPAWIREMAEQHCREKYHLRGGLEPVFNAVQMLESFGQAVALRVQRETLDAVERLIEQARDQNNSKSAPRGTSIEGWADSVLVDLLNAVDDLKGKP